MSEIPPNGDPTSVHNPEVVELVNALRKNPAWLAFKEKVIDHRIQAFETAVMAPLNNVEGAWAAERAKGAAIALRGLVYLFEAKLPSPSKESDDDIADTKSIVE